MFIQTATDEKAVLDDGTILKPAATLKWDKAGFKCHIAHERNGYTILAESSPRVFTRTPYITADVFAVLKNLPYPA